MLELVRRSLKFVSFLAIVVGFLARGMFIHLTTTDLVQRRKKFVTALSFWSRCVLKTFHIKVNLVHFPDKIKNYLVISNHLGFFDPFIMSAYLPSMLITSVELRETPMLGLVSEFAACVYVEARDRSNISNEMKDIESALNQGFNVVLYPEAKTTNGEMVHPFKKTLLMSCAETKADLLTTVLNFRQVNGERMSDKWRDTVFWYSKLSLAKVVWNATGVKTCVVDWEFIREIHVTPSSDRSQVAAEAQTLVEQRYDKIPLAYDHANA